MNKKIASAGNNGEKERSDCLVTIEQTDSGGITVNMIILLFPLKQP